MYKLLLVLLICVNLFSLSFSLSTTKYLATVHHSNSDFREKRNVQESQFVGDIIFNNTVNEKGEITLSLCDITKDVFSGSIPSLPLFNYDRSTRVAGIASAKLQASFNSRINIDGCLVFFFNPCCKTFGLKFVLDDPVILNAFGKLKVDVEAFNLGISLGSNDITLDPLQNIELKGFSPEIGSWNLPPILDKTIQLDDESLCAKLGVPGSNVGLDFCVVLGNFSAGINGVNVCPRLTISLGGRVLLDLSYTALSSDLPECLTLSFLPTCSYKGSSVSPDIVQLFKSSDANNDQKIMVSELQKSKLLLGIFESEEANSASFSDMDTNSDGEVNFAEFEKYTATQQEINASGDYVTKKEGKKFSGGDIAMAVIFSILGTALIVCAVLAGVAQYKGIINNKYLGKVIPTK